MIRGSSHIGRNIKICIMLRPRWAKTKTKSIQSGFLRKKLFMWPKQNCPNCTSSCYHVSQTDPCSGYIWEDWVLYLTTYFQTFKNCGNSQPCLNSRSKSVGWKRVYISMFMLCLTHFFSDWAIRIWFENKTRRAKHEYRKAPLPSTLH